MRKSPYLISFLFLLAATSLTILSVYVPDLIHTIVPTPGPLHFETKYGLYRRCTRKIPEQQLLYLELSNPNDISLLHSITRLKALAGPGDILDPIDGEGEGWQCQPFPNQSECKLFGEGFCVLWSTAGYMAQLSLVPCVISLIVLLIISLGGGGKKIRAKRRAGGWKIVSSLMGIHAILQIVSVALILHVYRTDDRFKVGAHLDTAADFGVASAMVSLSMVFALAFTGLAADAGQVWAGGKSVRKPKRKAHRRTRSGREVPIPGPSETTGLLEGTEEEDVEGPKSATGSRVETEEV